MEAASRSVDILVDLTTFLAWQVLLMGPIFTGRLDFADYRLPPWGSLAGPGLIAGAIMVFRGANGHLGTSWSRRNEVLKEQELATHGVYGHVRHSIEVGRWLSEAARPLLIHNWIAGLAFLATFLPLYVLRVPHEERTLIRRFGQTYLAYMARTPGLFPRLRRRDRPS